MTMRHRSPNYPGVNLEEAIEAVNALYLKYHTGGFTPTDAGQAWGYNSASGPVRVKLAALRQYGLVEGKKGANPKISRRGQVLVIRTRSSNEYQDEVRQAALSPQLFNDLYENRREDADGALREYLLLEKNFSEDGATRLIDVYHATLNLAQLNRSDALSGLNGDMSDAEETWEENMPTGPSTVQDLAHHAPRSTQGHTRLPLRLPGGIEVAIELPPVMPESAWTHMIEVLNILKAGYVSPETNGREENSRVQEGG